MHTMKIAATLLLSTLLIAQTTPKPRARDLGIPFDGVPGKLNAITDVAGVEVGYSTLISGEGKLVVGQGPVRTGVTAIFPRGKNNLDAVFAGFHSGNGNGDMTGTHWIDESGVLETPITITSTLSVGVVRDAVVGWMVKHGFPAPFFYPVSAETADARLNDIKGQHVKTEDALHALDTAHTGRIEEGNVGGGTGMTCNGFKGGTGTASRVIDAGEGGYTVGVLVQCNYGNRNELRIAGIPVGREIKGYGPCVTRQLDPPQKSYDGRPAPVCERQTATLLDHEEGRGSIIVIVATDAPLTPDQLRRIARRVTLGLGRMGSIESDGSGDLFLAFSTANAHADIGNGAEPDTPPVSRIERVISERMNPLFLATIQATEEAITNAMITAETMTGADYWRTYAIPHEQLREILRKHGRLRE